MWQQILNFLDQGWVGSLLGILGILAGLFFYLASTKRKILAYEIRTEKLIEELKYNIDGLKISYHDQPIKNLAVSKVIIWNQGRDVVRSNDISDLEPVEVSVIGGEIIGSITLISLKDKRNGFELQRPSTINLFADEIFVKFSYLSFHDGCIVQFFHTWEDSIHIVAKGTVIGGSRIKKGEYLGDAGKIDFRFSFALYLVFWLLGLIAFILSTETLLVYFNIDPSTLYFRSENYSFINYAKSL